MVECTSITAQVVIGGTVPDGSASLEIQGNSMGFLLPRLTTDERNAINMPATGLMIFNTSTICFEGNIGTPLTPEWIKMGCRTGKITDLKCQNAYVTDSIFAGVPVNGVKLILPYTGGNGGGYNSFSFKSIIGKGVTAVTAGGNFANGDGELVFDLSGQVSGGFITFNIEIDTESCNVDIEVFGEAPCGAYVNESEWKSFYCYNLGAANMAADPFTPSWEIVGGYWQWGKLSQSAPGPSGPGIGEANEGPVVGWMEHYSPPGSWQDSIKTSNDPCPDGYRVPSKVEFDGLIANNSPTAIGTWFESHTNYGSGYKFGNNLFLPANGGRFVDTGGLVSRGVFGTYWSSTREWGLYLPISYPYTDDNSLAAGLGIRCIEE